MKTGYVILIASLLASQALYNIALGQNTSDVIWAHYNSVSIEKNGTFSESGFRISSAGETPIADIIGRVKYCPKDSGYICIHGDFWHFAIPRHQLKIGDKWRFGNSDFSVITSYGYIIPDNKRIPHSADIKRSISILGKSITYYAIRESSKHNPDDCIDVYLFSFKQGLIGITGECQKTLPYNGSTAFLEESYGPGSPEFDSKISKDAFMTKTEVSKLAH